MALTPLDIHNKEFSKGFRGYDEDEVNRSAQKEAKLIMKEAEKNADRIVNESLSKARKIALEIEELKKQSKVFRTRFKMLVEAQLDLLNNDDWDHLLEYEIDSTELKATETEDSLA